MTSDRSTRSAQRIVDVLTAYEVPYVFGVPGAKIDAVFDALVDGGPELVVCRHEQNAAFMAGAIGRLTGTPGVVLVTSGPGTTNLATGLLTANTEQDPVVALCGAVGRADRLKRTHQSMDAAAFLTTVTKHTGEVNDADNAAEATVGAFRAALTEPQGAAALVLPSDVLSAPTAAAITTQHPVPALAAAPHHRDPRGRRPHHDRETSGPPGRRSRRGTRQLCSGARSRVHHRATRGRDISGRRRDLPRPRVALPGDAWGCSAINPATSSSPKPTSWSPSATTPSNTTRDCGTTTRPATVVHIDSLPASIDNHYQPVSELRGNIADTLVELTRLLSGMTLADTYVDDIARQRQALADIDTTERAIPSAATGLNPTSVVLALREHLDDDATIACDVGSVYIYMARHFRVYEPRRLLFSNGQQTLGVALPWAMAAALVRPGTHIVSISGDGGFLFSAQELETAARLGLNLTHVILRDNTYDMVGFQEVLKYGRKSGVQLGDYDITHYAAAFGARGYRVDSLDEFTSALAQALGEDGPSVIDVAVDYSRNTDLAAHLHDDSFE
jgi:acetolactate synthase-1/2/3 large subunit